MGLFDGGRRARAAESAANAMVLKEKNRQAALNVVGILAENINSFMKSHNLADEFYSTGIKQGKYAGLMPGNDNTISRRNSRIVYNESPIAQSLVSTFSTLTVGHGLMLESQPFRS